MAKANPLTKTVKSEYALMALFVMLALFFFTYHAAVQSVQAFN